MGRYNLKANVNETNIYKLLWADLFYFIYLFILRFSN